ncbi:hypothetical protein K1T71_002853 [Dendrolimus kikuchii]|uniref:Uncharacterized protein n=5 Tax=Dendrolimus kikuchii TaxID=765133 RepID=A0ACC1CI34_9NEOP|nr:hypothetical protein K1T71_013298 [Dendrolimus kikuchii]KAJ0171421.1 hypothetical protein K1T71_012971 [Dendrolimus kikuchii]KAJ0176801.1 hypothetical protein K1T71_007980 [Dendrolimus kikuchii]KAJ0178727.1 hypothetical protein K1T71_005502 [Dendrolimus kikuchii]KAJ0182131.1 hypothetical protein K1T71_002853 [Dendrolimus kikuchii]
MPRTYKSNLQLSDEDKKARRREQKKMSMRRARKKLDEIAKEEIRRKDRERYYKKKEKGEIKTIDQYTPRQQRQIRKMWREKSKKRRELLKMRKAANVLLEDNTPPISPSSSFSRIEVGRLIAARNKRERKAENEALKIKVLEMRRIIKRYRMRIRRLEAKKHKVINTPSSSKNALKRDVRTAVHDFLVKDEYSRLTAGKNETITRKKSKRQIRLLNDTLLNLHKVFQNETGMKISYQTFRRYRPFWVLFPKASTRNTCLCALHENSDYIVRSLYKAQVISYGSASDMAKAICCNNRLNRNCLERRCKDCKNKKVAFNDFNGDDFIIYDRWIIKNVGIIVKGKEKQCKKCIKETVKTTKKSLVRLFNLNLPVYMQHMANLIHQIKTVQTLKQQLSPTEALLHIDFSENYNCKYSSEVQSAHFGGSKPQLSLHTCVYYSNNLGSLNSNFNTTPMCTISENLRHDPVMICAHLRPILHRIREISPNLTDLHILSDGPTTQYRNKSMFYLIANFLGKELNNVNNIIWHYSEKGHGKGAPDGVGGCVKRLCDNSVALGKDVSNYDSLMTCLKENCRGIEIYGIGDPSIQDIQEIMDQSPVKAFKGTLKIHQLSWSRNESNILHARRLSCLSCPACMICPHFEIGQITVQHERVVFNSPNSMSHEGTLSPRSISSSQATTETFRSDLITPEEEIFQSAPICPKKRLRLISISDESEIFPVHSRKKIFFTVSEDEDSIF